MAHSHSVRTLRTNGNPHTAGFVIKIGKKPCDFNLTDFFFWTIKSTSTESFCAFCHYTVTELQLTVLIFKQTDIRIVKHNTEQNKGYKEYKPCEFISMDGYERKDEKNYYYCNSNNGIIIINSYHYNGDGQ